jgi:ERCC4-type nuclease
MIDIKKCKYKIIVDTREKQVNHILNKFDEGLEEKPSHHDMFRGKKSTFTNPIGYFKQEKGLKTGDFTLAVQLPNQCVINFQDKIVIERKKDLNELCCNLFDKKDSEGLTRFERELSRSKEQGIKVILLVEVEDMHSKILSSKYFRFDKASKVSPKAFNSILRTLQARYNISIEYCNKKDSARLIHDILYYHAREYLKNVSIMKDKYIVNEIA